MVYARARGWPVGTFLDCSVPGLCLGQAIGRFGNYFNQELFGGPTDLPWGLHVDPASGPSATRTSRPSIRSSSTRRSGTWRCSASSDSCGASCTAASTPARSSPRYLCLYGIGRFAIEGLRIDDAIDVGALRINQVISLAVVATGFLLLVLLDKRRVPR